jgi:hypothetical protein
MTNVQGNGPTPYSHLAQPPTASDGADLYIEKLLVQSGMPPSSKHKDSFEKAGVASAQTHKTFADKALKWTGIVFASALAIVGVKYAFGNSAKKAAETAAEALTL